MTFSGLTLTLEKNFGLRVRVNPNPPFPEKQHVKKGERGWNGK